MSKPRNSMKHKNDTLFLTNKYYSTTKVSKVLILFFILFLLLDGACAITFFYGASEPSNDERVDESSSSNEQHKQNEKSDNAETKLTNEDMYSVYQFCNILPKLETIGKVRKSKVTREICHRLVTILHPMFRRADEKI